MTKRLEDITDDQLRELTYEEYGQTLYLDASTAGNLLELKRTLWTRSLTRMKASFGRWLERLSRRLAAWGHRLS